MAECKTCASARGVKTHVPKRDWKQRKYICSQCKNPHPPSYYNYKKLATFEDEDRFVEIIKQAIKDNEVKSYKAFTNESAASKKERRDAALEEQDEAEQHAKDLGISKAENTDDLAAMILSRGKARTSFLGILIVSDIYLKYTLR